MNITKQQIDDLNAVVTIQVSPEDYQEKVEGALKKAQRQASMPGFRPGKVPAGMIKKMYGKSVLVDEINKLLNDSIYSYINENKIEILGNPLPKVDGQESIDWDNQKDFTFNYELGLSPVLNIDISDKTTVDYHLVKVDDALLEKYLKDVRKNYGKPSNPEVSEANDVLYVDINELDPADGTIKAGGVFKSTSIGIDRIKNDAVKTRLTGLKKEDKLILKSKELYETAVDLGIGLGIDKETAETFDSDLQLTVRNIARMEDADLNQELFDKLYGEGKINSLDEFKAKISEELTTMFTQDQDRRFLQDVEKTLVEKYNPKLPEDFLKRWLIASNDKPLTMDQINNEFNDYAKAMQWKLIENKIIQGQGLKVTAEEATEEAKRFIHSQYARYGQTPSDEEVEKLTKTVLGKESEVQKIYENLYASKMLTLFKEKFKLNTKETSYNEFFGIKD
ncbi:MAG: trigger factor [Bacteroidetes bacterium]|jgi:trigger factor|nr:trigger factor [Bacteroidota bacterium]